MQSFWEIPAASLIRLQASPLEDVTNLSIISKRTNCESALKRDEKTPVKLDRFHQPARKTYSWRWHIPVCRQIGSCVKIQKYGPGANLVFNISEDRLPGPGKVSEDSLVPFFPNTPNERRKAWPNDGLITLFALVRATDEVLKMF